ncbi:MAG: 23S rRNA (pseudouridine(1915)-N(3))-methyltransferase RlmH [Parvibaculales bacterium]
MKLAILAVGQLRGQGEAALYEAYGQRIAGAGRNIAIDGPQLIEIKDQQGANEKLAAALDNRQQAFVVALDETGKQLSSRAFAQQLGAWRDDGIGELVFVLGAADGLSDAVRQRANMMLSLGPMTWPHLLARVLLAEQIWRGISILTGHPYHRD